MLKIYKIFIGIALSFFCLLTAQAQSLKITGVVTDGPAGQGIPGASVTIKGKETATVTDVNGSFSISANVNDIIRISYLGYANKEIKVTAGTTQLKISLEASLNDLNEVVVTALGITKAKKSLGYAVQELKSKDISTAKEPNLINSLAGKIAGVQTTNSQGDMGSSRIIIRGETSISSQNQPLFVVDGVPVDNSQFLGNGGSRDFANAISDINSEDIESISVLKGPNAAALYGSRAAAGVILIKTKTGRGQQGLGISINSNTTISNLLTLPKYQNAFGQGSNGEFSYVNGAGGGIKDGVDESWGPPLDGRLIPQFNTNGKPEPFIAHPNNVRDFFETGYALSNGVALAGSGEKQDVRFSYNNLTQGGIMPNSSQNKNSLLLNTTYRITPKLTLNANVNYIKSSAANLPASGGKRATGPMLQFTWFGRQVDVTKLKKYKDENGNDFNWNNSYYSNPYFIAYENTVGQKRDRIIGSAELNYKITDALSANFRTGNDYYTDRRKIKVAFGTNGTPTGSYQEDAYTVNENNTEGRLEFNKKLNNNFSLNVLAGVNIRTNTLEQNDQMATKLAVRDLYTLNNSRDPLVSSNFYSKLRTYSTFGSAQLGYKDYAFLNLTARNDWDSSLPRPNLSYFYPSANGSIILTEAFDIKSDVLSFAKIRGGWSKVGKATEPYQLANTYTFTAPFDGNPQQGAGLVDLNPNLLPEITKSAEAGIELGLFDNRVKLDLSVYNTNSINQILKINVSPSTGYSQKLINGGSINNKGLEVQLGLNPVKSRDFSWDISLNYALNRSKVTELDKEGLIRSYTIGTNRTVDVLATIGKPYGTFFGTAYQRNADGQILVGAGGTPIINPEKQYLGKFTPNWLGGISNSFTYKNINLNFLIDARIGGKVYSNSNRTGTYTGVLESTLKGRNTENGGLSYYFPGNVNTGTAVGIGNGGKAPAGETVYTDGVIFDGVLADGTKNGRILPAQQYYKGFTNVDEQFMYDASYIKLREVKLSYNLPDQWTRKIGFQNATLSLVGRNLWIIHKNVPNIDPETAFNVGNAQGLEDLSLPTTRSFGFNLNLKF